MKWLFFLLIGTLTAMQQDEPDKKQKVPSLMQIAQDQVLQYIANGKCRRPLPKKTVPQEVYESLKARASIYYCLKTSSVFDAISSKQNLENMLGLDIDVNLKIKSLWTLLHTAVCDGELDVITYLLDKGADVNTKNTMGYTPLHIGCERNNTEIIKLLLRYNPNVNSQEIPFLRTPLHILVRFTAKKHTKKNLENIRLLLNAGADLTKKDNMGNTPLDCATNLKVINLLKEHAQKNQ